jgi:hypothetical protein
MFVEFAGKETFRSVGVKPSFRTYGAGKRPLKFYKHFAPDGAKTVHGFLDLALAGVAPRFSVM